MQDDNTKALRRDEIIQGLRELADWMEETPDALVHGYTNVSVRYWTEDKDSVVKLAQTGGRMKKEYYGESFDLRKDFGPVRYEMTIAREQVCERKVVGTKKVEKVDPEAYKLLPRIEVDEDVIEWECHSLLAPETEDTVG